jgi:hypothetical protein
MTWEAKPTGKRGRQPTYSDAAIQTRLSINTASFSKKFFNQSATKKLPNGC